MSDFNAKMHQPQTMWREIRLLPGVDPLLMGERREKINNKVEVVGAILFLCVIHFLL